MSQAAADALIVEAQALFRRENYAEAAARYEKATQVYPQHALAWKGLGHSLLCMGRAHEATRAFDQAIGFRPDSATALWGGAVAHADVGNKVVAQNYLNRALALQPTWIEMARTVVQLQPFLQVSTRAAEALRHSFGAFSTQAYRYAGSGGEARVIEVGQIANQPRAGQWTFVTIGLSNREWPAVERPRIELAMATVIDHEVCGQILANLAFHLGETGFFPEPGVMVRDVVGALAAGDVSRRLPHIYISVPRAWALHLPIEHGPPAVTLAQVIPVSEAEYVEWRAHPAGFEAALARRNVDVADLRRSGT